MKRSSRWSPGGKSTGFFMKTQKELAPSSLVRPRNPGAQRKPLPGRQWQRGRTCLGCHLSKISTLCTKLWLFMTPKQSPAMWCFSSSLAIQVQDWRMQIFGLIHDWVWEGEKNYSKIVPQAVWNHPAGTWQRRANLSPRYICSFSSNPVVWTQCC